MEITIDFQEQIISLNKNSMSLIKANDFKGSLKLLKESLNLLALAKEDENKYKLLAITHNNLGCIYKQRKKPTTALKYLKLSSENEAKARIDPVTRAGTFLNTCAIFSSLGKHKLALEESQKALNLLKTEEDNDNFFATLVIAYHNVAVEHEYLKEFKASLEFYKLACETAEKHLGPDHPLTRSASSDYKKAERAIQDHELLSVVKDINTQEISLRLFSPKRETFKRRYKLQEKLEVLKKFPYIPVKKPKLNQKRLSIDSQKPSTDEPAEKKFLDPKNSNKRTKSVSLTPNIKTFPSPRNFSPARATNRLIITAPEHKSRLKSLELKLSSKEIMSKTLHLNAKPTSLRSKTLLLLQELETLKVQAREEKIIESHRETPVVVD